MNFHFNDKLNFFSFLALLFLCSLPSIILNLIVINSGLILSPDISSGQYIVNALGLYEDGEYTYINHLLERSVELKNLPLYPIFLYLNFLVFGKLSFIPILFFQSFLHGATSIIIGKIISKFNKNWFLIGCLVSSIWPHLVWRSSYIFPETLFVFFITISLYFLINFILDTDNNKLKNLIFYSIFISLSFLTRLSGILLIFTIPVFIFFFLFIHKKEIFIKSCLISILPILISIILLSPWGNFIYKNTGEFALSSQSGSWLLNHTYPCLCTKFGCGKRDPDCLKTAISRYDSRLNEITIDNEILSSNEQKKLAKELILELPKTKIVVSTIGSWIKVFYHTIINEFFGRFSMKETYISNYLDSDKEFLEDLYNNKTVLFWFLFQFSLIISRILQLSGLIKGILNKRTSMLFIGLSIFILTFLMPMIGNGVTRYRIPLEPVLIIFTFAGFIKKNRL